MRHRGGAQGVDGQNTNLGNACGLASAAADLMIVNPPLGSTEPHEVLVVGGARPLAKGTR